MGVRKRRYSVNHKNLGNGLIRAIGWFVACITTEGWGMSSMSVLSLFAAAVLIETIGLIWSEICDDSKSGLRSLFITFEFVTAFSLLALCLLTMSGVVSIDIGGRSFYQATSSYYHLDLPDRLYLGLYFSPVFCALLWSIRAGSLVFTNRRRTIY